MVKEVHSQGSKYEISMIGAANSAEKEKREKYREYQTTYHRKVIPFGLSSSGEFGESATKLISMINKVAKKINKPITISQFTERISFTIETVRFFMIEEYHKLHFQKCEALQSHVQKSTKLPVSPPHYLLHKEQRHYSSQQNSFWSTLFQNSSSTETDYETQDETKQAKEVRPITATLPRLLQEFQSELTSPLIKTRRYRTPPPRKKSSYYSTAPRTLLPLSPSQPLASSPPSEREKDENMIENYHHTRRIASEEETLRSPDNLVFTPKKKKKRKLRTQLSHHKQSKSRTSNLPSLSLSSSKQFLSPNLTKPRPTKRSHPLAASSSSSSLSSSSSFGLHSSPHSPSLPLLRTEDLVLPPTLVPLYPTTSLSPPSPPASSFHSSASSSSSSSSSSFSSSLLSDPSNLSFNPFASAFLPQSTSLSLPLLSSIPIQTPFPYQSPAREQLSTSIITSKQNASVEIAQNSASIAPPPTDYNNPSTTSHPPSIQPLSHPTSPRDPHPTPPNTTDSPHDKPTIKADLQEETIDN
jgi:hypothetical protein